MALKLLVIISAVKIGIYMLSFTLCNPSSMHLMRKTLRFFSPMTCPVIKGENSNVTCP